eukprot:GFUD01044632.1.p1 GENE.GFUD01044632.1~~GFUD01044632.1.p1  ORF type:complete len:346 (+),score=67.80 GFUD01044632.1:158-1195(+)
MNFGGSVRVNPTGVAIMCGIVILIIFFNSGGRGSASSKTAQTVNLKQLLSVAIAAAEAGGREVVAVRAEADLGESSKGETLEGANDPKTNGDMRSHVQMYYGIRKAFPDINIISEEHDEKEVDMSKIPDASIHNAEVEEKVTTDQELPVDEVAVWIDPLDATQEYTENLKEYVTTMVCIAVKGKPTIGIIHKPFDKITAWGWAGEDVLSKVLLDDVANNKANVHTDLSTARIIVSRSHSGTVNETAQNLLGPGITVTPAGGAGYKAWEVIKGTQDAYIHTTLIKKWDICPGAAILSALNGKLTTLDGEEIDYGNGDEEKNKGGLLATMYNHDKFLEKFKVLKPTH